MPKKGSNRTAFAILILFLAAVLGVSAFFQGGNPGSFALGIEPRSGGFALSYWTEHAYWYSGSQRLENVVAANAIRKMGDRALPFLVKWVATVNHSSQ